MNSRGKPRPRQIYSVPWVRRCPCYQLFSRRTVSSWRRKSAQHQLHRLSCPGFLCLPWPRSAPFGPVFPGDPTSPREPFAPSGPGQPWSPRGPGVPGIPGMPFEPCVPGIPPQHRRKAWKSRRTVLRTCHLTQSIGYRLVSRSHTGALPRRPRETEFPSSLKDQRLSYSRTRIQKTWTPTLEQISSFDCSMRW